MATHKDTPELRFHEQFARIGKAVGSPKRIQLVQVLAQGERSVEELAKETETGMANTSGHLRVLRESGLVKTRREGTRIFYSLADDDVARFFVVLRKLAHSRLAEIEQLLSSYVEEPGDDGSLDPHQVLELCDAEGAALVDVRPTEEYAAGHVRGALSIPLGELAERIGELPDDRPVVVYCRGPYSSLSYDAMRLLSEAGLDVRRMSAGFPEWRLEGLPVVGGEESAEAAESSG